MQPFSSRDINTSRLWINDIDPSSCWRFHLSLSRFEMFYMRVTLLHIFLSCNYNYIQEDWIFLRLRRDYHFRVAYFIDHDFHVLDVAEVESIYVTNQIVYLLRCLKRSAILAGCTIIQHHWDCSMTLLLCRRTTTKLSAWDEKKK